MQLGLQQLLNCFFVRDETFSCDQGCGLEKAKRCSELKNGVHGRFLHIEFDKKGQSADSCKPQVIVNPQVKVED